MSAGKKISKRGATRRWSKGKSTKANQSTKSSVRGKTDVIPAPKGGRKGAANSSLVAAATPTSYGVRPSKLATVISMLQQRGGTTIEALCAVTGWQAHSVRGALSGALKKKLGLTVMSDKTNGIRSYRLAD